MSGPMPPEIRRLAFCQGLLSFGQALAFPFIAIYLYRDCGVPMTWVGAALSVSVLATAFSQGLGGELSDRIGSVRVMRWSIWLRAATVFALSASVADNLGPLPVVALMILSNFCIHLFEPAARDWVADHASARRRHGAYGLLKLASYAGFVGGPYLGGRLSDHSYAAAFFASGSVCLLAALAATLLLKEGSESRKPRQEKLDWSRETGIDDNFRALCLHSAVLSVAMAQFVVPFSIFANKFIGLKDSQIGLLFSLNALLVVLFQFPAIAAFKGVRLTRIIFTGAVLFAVGFGTLSMAQGFAGLAVSVAVLSLAEILVPPAAQALAANMAPKEQRGRFLGTVGLSRQFGAALGPLLGMAGLSAAAATGWHGHWLAVSVVALAGAAGFLNLGSVLLPDEEGLWDEAAEALGDAAGRPVERDV